MAEATPDLTVEQIRWGSREPRPEQLLLRAGPVTALFVGGDLRLVRVGQVEICRRIYTAVRDTQWGTLPANHSPYLIEQRSDSFDVSYTSHHSQDDIDLSWSTTISGTPEGTISFGIEGVSDKDFSYNRIGICLHHPPEWAGARCKLETPEGYLQAEFPELIGPQWIEDGKILAILPAFSELDVEVDIDRPFSVHHRLSGDLFEMEDQRNWTDGSFKTYSTPLALGWPHEMSVGDEVRQTVIITPRGLLPRPTEDRELRLEGGEVVRPELPEIGFAIPSHDRSLSTRQIELVSALEPDHIRLEIFPGSADLDEVLSAAEVVGRLEAPAEVVIFAEDRDLGELPAVAAQLAATGMRVRRFLIFDGQGETIGGSSFARARAALGGMFPDASFVGGTDAFFAELNRTRPNLGGMDGLVYSINPQVHAFDELSLVEGLAAQGDTVRTAKSFGNGQAVSVSPVTLRPRPRPPRRERHFLSAQDPPTHVDPRQASLFGAAWTLGSLKHLIESGVDSVTFFELTGPLGLMETAAGSAWPDRFPSAAGMIYPIYHVFRLLARVRHRAVRSLHSTDPLTVEGLWFSGDEGDTVIIANLTATSRRVKIPGLGEVTSVQVLDENNALTAMTSPTLANDVDRSLDVENREEFNISPYGIVCLEGSPLSSDSEERTNR